MFDTTSTKTAERVKTVKVAPDKAPMGVKRKAARKTLQAAEKAQTVKNDAEFFKALDAKMAALV